eukprot:1087321-Pyramimonas_sp.AAC.1
MTNVSNSPEIWRRRRRRRRMTTTDDDSTQSILNVSDLLDATTGDFATPATTAIGLSAAARM